MKKNLRQKAYEKIKEMILFLEMKPGHKIFESEISERIKIGRTPVREALMMLENEKLVVSGNNKGFSVRSLSSKDIDEYFKMRILLEEFAIPLIIERITLSEIRLLEQNIENTEEAIGEASLQKIIRHETKFHEILYRATKSEILIDTISYLVDRFQWLRAIALSTEQEAQESLSDHKMIFEAIVDKDQRRIKKLFREHLQHGKRKVYAVQGLF